MNRLHPSLRWIPAAAVRLGALYLLAGALAKLFLGSPADLPPRFHDLPLGLDMVFRMAITAELAVAFAALLVPAVAWPLLAATFLVFVVVLADMTVAGVESCGCFGTAVVVPPAVMLAVDAVLLAGILSLRPWANLVARGLRPALLVPALLLALGAPFLFLPPAAAGLPPAENGPWSLPERLPRYVILTPHRWVGQEVRRTQLAAWIDPDIIPPDATLILYRQTCSVCAEHLKELAEEPGEDLYVLVRLPTPRDAEENLVRAKPAMLVEYTLHEAVDWVLTVPWELTLRDGVVQDARLLTP